MERLTKKGASNYIVNCRPECVEKLVSIEDFEESMGIELSILIKANMNGIYGIQLGHHWIEHYDVQIDFNEKSLCHNYKYWEEELPYDFYFKDYGVTWALTQEEMEAVLRKEEEKRKRDYLG